MPVRYDIIKTYPARGLMQQYRLGSTCSFVCFRCGAEKTSKLVTVANGSWSQLLCNGCYGRLVSMHDVRAGIEPTDIKAQMLAECLGQMFSVQEVRKAEELLKVRESHARHLHPTSVRFMATAECVAHGLRGHLDLDWSAAVIGLCKAFEVELVQRVVEPLRSACAGLDLTSDINDKDLGRVAKYCAGRSPVPPEMGTLRHALQTAEHSTQRAESSTLVQTLRAIMKQWPHADWLVSRDGGLSAIEAVTSRFRNRAAHTEVLGASDYAACWDVVAGESGVLWSLARATSPRR